MFENLLPEHWKISNCEGGVIIYAKANAEYIMGAVSVDFKKRGFAFGVDSFIASLKNKYFGRGWRDALIKDAIEELKKAVG